MAKNRKSGKHFRETRRVRDADTAGREPDVRIIGGRFRGRRLRYHGDPVVRPMKHRTREAIFNLITTDAVGRHAIDLFAGTGALGLEALSRGATAATFIEKHVPSARIIEENICTLGVADRAVVLVTSAFLWAKRDLLTHIDEVDRKSLDQNRAGEGSGTVSPAHQPHVPWLVFCSPPYALYHERSGEMLDLIRRIQKHAPAGSVLVVETDEKFDFAALAGQGASKATAPWMVRSYPPAVIGICQID